MYSVGGRERLETPAGQFETLKLIKEGEKDRTEIWLAADRSYLPVRILVTEKDGTRYDQVLVRISTP